MCARLHHQVEGWWMLQQCQPTLRRFAVGVVGGTGWGGRIRPLGDRAVAVAAHVKPTLKLGVPISSPQLCTYSNVGSKLRSPAVAAAVSLEKGSECCLPLRRPLVVFWQGQNPVVLISASLEPWALSDLGSDCPMLVEA